jgi:D-alanyl-D-alanine carboxypeptidase
MALLAALTALSVFAVLAAAEATPDPVAESHKPGARSGLQPRLDAVVTVGAVGALARVVDDHRVWRSTSGAATLGTTRPVPPRGRFRVGSVTKTFVATVVVQLSAEHRLELTDPVERWLPGVVPGGERITVRQLLDHTSGLYDYLRTLPFPPSREFQANRWRTWTPEELSRRVMAHPPEFTPPGSAFSYSNTNYLLLGQIIERATGRPYAEQIQQRIIRPLHLSGTQVPGTSPRIRGSHPHGYVPAVGDDGQVRLVDYTAMNPSVMGASGEMISTTRDLDRFFAALLGGRLVGPDLLAQMKTPGIAGADYGLGLWWRDTSCGVRVYGNDGDALAYQAWSYSTADLRHRVTVAFTPDSRADTDATVEELIDDAICG